MGLRLPLQGVLDVTHTNLGDSSVAGGWAYDFKLPQDVDNVVVKFEPSVTAGGYSAIFQTSDDGGTTYYDVARTSIASNSGATGVTGAAAQWLSIPVVSGGVNPLVVSNAQAGSVAGGTIGSASASTLGSRQVSGLPVLGIQNRIFLISTGNLSAVSARVRVLCNSQNKGV
jgi:hypothetical protein